jgi:DNA-binding transcriptional regulator YhcF (GntR family)
MNRNKNLISTTDMESHIAQSIELIKNKALLPRSEYYSRFKGTTAFDMDDPTHWNSYHRSEASRFFAIVGKRKNAQFLSPCVKKPQKANSFFSHMGGYHSPFTFPYYRDEITLKDKVLKGNISVRDKLLEYKINMAKAVVESFETTSGKNEQRLKNQHNIRPIVYEENNYPCVLIALPALNRYEIETESVKYWSEHPKIFQKLLYCIFIALLNVNSMREKIPIEMVIRASFGHNLPSVCETHGTFRINIGIVPRCYAELMGKTLHQLNQIIGQMCDKTSKPASLSKEFLKKVGTYNVEKLINKIKEKKLYETLNNTSNFEKARSSDKAFSKLYKEFCNINKKQGKKGISRFKPVELNDQTIWQIIRQAANSKGNSVLYECFRQNGTDDWFVNQVMDALLTNDKDPIEFALKKLLECLSYNEKVSMNYAKIKKELKCDKHRFEHPSFEQLYTKDPEFSNIVTLLSNAFLIEKQPLQALYATLEQASIKLFTTYRGSDVVSENPDYGSDSDFSEDLSDSEQSAPSNHISHIKLRVCSGMKAIVLAQYGALCYLHSLDVTEYYAKDSKQMYYEVADAIKYIALDLPKVNNVRAVWEIWHFDLNHCNADNSENTHRITKKLTDLTNETIAILDYTSSTASTIKETVKQCFSNKKIQSVIFVNSGLKNDQGGADFNPYGEVRIFARDRKTCKKIFKMMKKGLSDKDKLSQQSHEIVRVCKRSGLALSFHGIFCKHKNGLNIEIEEEKQDGIQKTPQQQEAPSAAPVNTSNSLSAAT